MTWKKKIKNKKRYSPDYTDRSNYSTSYKLRKEGRTIPEFEVMLASLSLEEVIALKLELAAKSAGGMLYGLPLWHSMPIITRDALLKFALSICETNMEAAKFLGIDKAALSMLIRKYDIDTYFKPQPLTKNTE